MKFRIIKLFFTGLIFNALILFSCQKKNNPPKAPTIISCPAKGSINIPYNFFASSQDIDEDSIAFRFDWNDGEISNWTSFVRSGELVSMSHSWRDSGIYRIRVQAKDNKGAISEWSNFCEIIITKAPPGWTRTFGGWGDDYGYSVCETKDGGYIIAGYTESFGAGRFDIYLIKTDEKGNQKWSKALGTLFNDFGYSVCETKDGGYVVAGYTSFYGTNYYDDNVYLIKTDANGNLQWSRILGNSDWNYAYSVKETKDGGFIIVGYTSPYGAGGSDVYLIKTDANGNVNWP